MASDLLRQLPVSRILDVALKIGRYSILAGVTLALLLIVSVLLTPPLWVASVGGTVAAVLIWPGIAILLIGTVVRKMKMVV